MIRFKPNSTVATIIEHKGKLLFVEETDNDRTVFNQPAGHIEENETLIQAAQRETLEETGHNCEITHYIGLYTYKAPSNGVMYHRHCFAAKSTHYNPDHPLDEGIIAAKWMTLEELINSGQARSPLVIKCAQDYLDNKRYPLELIYEHPYE
ncbi:NUDIX hydrolase [Oceaniserpentilla sp. 4NH20-0058]|uniref:NUDIX hydrolase n=1 Tax=Oceaniserpentilla sp. 4NH20-0058 TaxID=3127660 RepID=UPI0031086C9D